MGNSAGADALVAIAGVAESTEELDFERRLERMQNEAELRVLPKQQLDAVVATFRLCRRNQLF